MVAEREREYTVRRLEVAGRRPGGRAKSRFMGVVEKDKELVGWVRGHP